MDHKRPKLWNGPNALGEALVRGLELTGSPYLTAIAGDVYAGVMDGKGEVKFGGEVLPVGYITTPATDEFPAGVDDAPAFANLKARVTRDVPMLCGSCVLWGDVKNDEVITGNPNVPSSARPHQIVSRYIPFVGNTLYEPLQQKKMIGPEAAVYMHGWKIAAPGPVLGACITTLERKYLTVVVANSDTSLTVYVAALPAAKKKAAKQYGTMKNAKRVGGELSPDWSLVNTHTVSTGFKLWQLFTFSEDGKRGGAVIHRLTGPYGVRETSLLRITISALPSGEIEAEFSAQVSEANGITLLTKQNLSDGDYVAFPDEYLPGDKWLGLLTVRINDVATRHYTGVHGSYTEFIDACRDIIDPIADTLDYKLTDEEGMVYYGYNYEIELRAERYAVGNGTRIRKSTLTATYESTLAGEDLLGVAYDAGVECVVKARVTSGAMQCMETRYDTEEVSRPTSSDGEFSDHYNGVDLGSYLAVEAGSTFSFSGDLSYEVVVGERPIARVTARGGGSCSPSRKSRSDGPLFGQPALAPSVPVDVNIAQSGEFIQTATVELSPIQVAGAEVTPAREIAVATTFGVEDTLEPFPNWYASDVVSERYSLHVEGEVVWQSANYTDNYKRRQTARALPATDSFSLRILSLIARDVREGTIVPAVPFAALPTAATAAEKNTMTEALWGVPNPLYTLNTERNGLLPANEANCSEALLIHGYGAARKKTGFVSALSHTRKYTTAFVTAAADAPSVLEVKHNFEDESLRFPVLRVV